MKYISITIPHYEGGAVYWVHPVRLSVWLSVIPGVRSIAPILLKGFLPHLGKWSLAKRVYCVYWLLTSNYTFKFIRSWFIFQFLITLCAFILHTTPKLCILILYGRNADLFQLQAHRLIQVDEWLSLISIDPFGPIFMLIRTYFYFW